MSHRTISMQSLQPASAPPVRAKWKTEPTLREILLLVLVTGLVFLVTVSAFRPYLAVVNVYGDNGSLLGISHGIRHWDFHDVSVKAFWGMSYLMAVVGKLTSTSDIFTLLFVSTVAGFATAYLAFRLWGGWVAAFFLTLNFAWIQRTFIGGTESAFMAFLCAAFLALRKDRPYLAAMFAAFATTVRPLAIFALAGIGLALLLRKRYKECAVATAIGLAIGALYALPLALIYKNPMANVQSYRNGDWGGGHLLNWPFVTIVKATLSAGVPWTNVVLTSSWVVLVFLGLFALLGFRSSRYLWHDFPAEMIFACTYIAFLFTYNAPLWARAEFVRFAIPVLPFVLIGIREWLPNDRRLVWAVAVVFAFLAGCSAVGIRNVLGAISG